MIVSIKADDWDRLYRKIGMLGRELEAFDSVLQEYLKLNSWIKGKGVAR